MKFSCSTNDLLQALNLVGRAIGGQQALPILGNILMEVEGKRCRVSATDLELSIITAFEAKIENEGSITMPAKAILNFAQYNNDPDVLLETSEGTQLKCVSRHAKAVISGESASEYPAITSIDRQTSFNLPLGPLLAALNLVTFTAAKTGLRPVLSGVYVRSEKDKLTFVATDSYRLSEYSISVKGAETDISCIIPVKILDELKFILGGKKTDKKADKKGDEKKEDADDPKSIEVALSRQQVGVTAGPTHLLSRLIDGKFPDYQQIIPKDPVTKVLFPTHELLTAAKRLHYFAKEVNNNLTFHCSGNQTRITTPQTQMGRDEATISAEVTGKEGKIALSSSFLLDFLSHITDEVVEMSIVDPMRPAIFRVQSEPNFLHLIMPLRMQEE